MTPRITLFLLALCLLAIPSTQAVDLAFDGVIQDRINAWDSYATHLYIDGTHHLWWCSTSQQSGSIDPQTDAIFYSTKSGSLGPGSWSTPIEVFNNTHTPIGMNHVCDPTVARGPFTYNATSYDFMTLYSYDEAIGVSGVNSREGVAFSNDGITWVAHTAPVITNDFPFDGTYGAGQGSVGWGPQTGILNHVYFDSTYPGLGEIRYRQTLDGVLFTPTPSLPNSMADNLQGTNFGMEPSIAYSPVTRRWYGVMRGFDDDGELIIVQADGEDTLDGAWSELGRVNVSLTGEVFNSNAGFARNADTTLFIDDDGWGYILFGGGNLNNVFLWKLYQVRFRVLGSQSLILDRFVHVGVDREPNDPIDGTATELGMRPWSATSTLVFGQTSGNVTNLVGAGQHIGGVPFSLSGQPGSLATIDANVNVTGGGWVAVGFAPTETTGVFGPNGLWVLLNDPTDAVDVFENGLNLVATAPVPNLSPVSNNLKLIYDPVANTVSVIANGSRVANRVPLTSTPTISAASINMLSVVGGSAGDMQVFDFIVDLAPENIFADGFESGDLSAWGSAVP